MWYEQFCREFKEVLLFFSLTWLDFDFGKNMEWKKSNFPFLVFIKTMILILNISTETQRMVIKSNKFALYYLIFSWNINIFTHSPTPPQSII